jgi:hypothetical protein
MQDAAIWPYPASVLDSGSSGERGRCGFRGQGRVAPVLNRGRRVPPELGRVMWWRGQVQGDVDGAGEAILDRLLESGTQEVYKWVLCCRSYRTHP